MLGSRKLLIFGIVSALVLSLLIVGVFAAEPEDVKALGGGGAVKAAPADFQIPAGKPFSSVTYIGTADGYNSTTGYALIGTYTQESPVYVTYLSVQTQNPSNSWLEPFNFTFEEPVPVYFYNANGWLHAVVDGHDNQVGYSSMRTRAALQNSVDELESVSSSLPLYTIPPTFNMGALFASLLGIGNQLISFVVARPIVLIPTVAMILVLSYGVIRRLIKGV